MLSSAPFSLLSHILRIPDHLSFSDLPTEIAEKILFFVPPRAELPLVLVCAKWHDILERRRALRCTPQWVTSRKIALGSSSLLRWAKDMGCGMVHVRTIGRKGREPGELDIPRGMALHNGKLWVTDTYNNRIQVFDTNTGECVATMGEPGEEDGTLSEPFGIAIAPSAGLVSCQSWMTESKRLWEDSCMPHLFMFSISILFLLGPEMCPQHDRLTHLKV